MMVPTEGDEEDLLRLHLIEGFYRYWAIELGLLADQSEGWQDAETVWARPSQVAWPRPGTG